MKRPDARGFGGLSWLFSQTVMDRPAYRERLLCHSGEKKTFRDFIHHDIRIHFSD